MPANSSTSSRKWTGRTSPSKVIKGKLLGESAERTSGSITVGRDGIHEPDGEPVSDQRASFARRPREEVQCGKEIEQAMQSFLKE